MIKAWYEQDKTRLINWLPLVLTFIGGLHISLVFCVRIQAHVYVYRNSVCSLEMMQVPHQLEKCNVSLYFSPIVHIINLCHKNILSWSSLILSRSFISPVNNLTWSQTMLSDPSASTSRVVNTCLLQWYYTYFMAMQ